MFPILPILSLQKLHTCTNWCTILVRFYWFSWFLLHVYIENFVNSKISAELKLLIVIPWKLPWKTHYTSPALRVHCSLGLPLFSKDSMLSRIGHVVNSFPVSLALVPMYRTFMMPFSRQNSLGCRKRFPQPLDHFFRYQEFSWRVIDLNIISYRQICFPWMMEAILFIGF